MIVQENLYPVYIATKGRALSSQTLSRLCHENIPYTAFVEYEDEKGYAEARPEANLVTLPKSNQGLSYVRQYIHEYARTKGCDWYWMLDDDIQSFYVVLDRKTVRADCSTVLQKAQSLFSSMGNIGQASLEYQQFAWSSTKEIAWNSYCDVCVCINVENTRYIDFSKDFNLKVDRDFTLQILAQGYATARCSRLAFSCPANSSNAGGLQSVYQTGGVEAEESKRLAAKWGSQICTVQQKKSGRIDAKINWRYFSKTNRVI